MGRTNINGPAHPATPSNGRALYAWIREAETLHEVGLVRLLTPWMRRNGLPPRFIDLDFRGVEICYREACRLIDIAHDMAHPPDDGG